MGVSLTNLYFTLIWSKMVLQQEPWSLSMVRPNNITYHNDNICIQNERYPPPCQSIWRTSKIGTMNLGDSITTCMDIKNTRVSILIRSRHLLGQLQLELFFSRCLNLKTSTLQPRPRSHLHSVGSHPSHAFFIASTFCPHLRGNSSSLETNVIIPGQNYNFLSWHHFHYSQVN